MMSATTGAVPAQPSKGAKKRSRGKKSVVDASVPVQDKPGSTAPASPVDGSTAAGASDTKPEKKFQVELNKRVRRSTKKLESIEKDEEKIKDLSPEDKLTTNLLNKDQLKKIEQKPVTQAVHNELIDLNKLYLEQLDILHDLEVERAKAQKAEFEEKLAVAVKEAKEQGLEEGRKEKSNEAKDKITSLVKFLRLAGYRRTIPGENQQENQAIEALLVLLYSGDEVALEASDKLASGSTENVEESQTVTYQDLKQLAYDLRIDDEPEPEPEGQPVAVESIIDAQLEAPLKTDQGSEETDTKQDQAELQANGMSEPEDKVTTNNVLLRPEQTAPESKVSPTKAEDEGSPTELAVPDVPRSNETIAPEDTPAASETGQEITAPSKSEEADPGSTGPTEKPASEASARSKDDDFVHVEHRRGRGGRGGYRGDRDGNFRGRGRGGYRGDRRGGERGRGGPYRGRGGRGRGGEHHVHPPVAPSS